MLNSANAQAKDSCGGVTIFAAIPGVNQNASLLYDDTISLNRTCPQTLCFQNNVTFTARDSCGLVISAVASFTIIDTIPPVFVIAPSNVTVPCDVAANASLSAWLQASAYASATDSCSNVTLQSTIIWQTATLQCNRRVTLLVTAKDAAGNMNSMTASFSIKVKMIFCVHLNVSN